jgi:hypothetical protein
LEGKKRLTSWHSAKQIVDFLTKLNSMKITKKMMDDLNGDVTRAVLLVEDAQLRLATAELAIAKVTSPNSTEGRIARRGAVRAALAARKEEWARELVKGFTSEKGGGLTFKSELKTMISR